MDSFPLSLLNDFLYCRRRAALKEIEGARGANEHTVRGEIAHEHADLAGYEVAKGVKLLRALPVFSDRLDLSGKCDIVEQWPDGSLFPVEYKKGKKRKFVNDDAQLCAQALCLEEMFGIAIPRGAIFHAESKRRRDVDFTPTLRQETETAVAALRALLAAGVIPAAVYHERCTHCSLYEVCLPKATGGDAPVRRLARQLFEISDLKFQI